MSPVAGSGLIASSKCGRNVPFRTVTTCGTVIASKPSSPCVTHHPLDPRPPKGVAGWAGGASASLSHTAPAGMRAASSAAAVVSAEKTDAASAKGDGETRASTSSVESNGITPATGAKHASVQTSASG